MKGAADDPGGLEGVWTAFPVLRDLPSAERDLLGRGVSLQRLEAGRQLFHEGAPCTAFVLLLSGVIKVSKMSETGREIVLYRVERGQTCVLTTACLMAGTAYEAEGRTETATEAAFLGAATFDALLATSPLFRRFAFSAYAVRLTDLLEVIESVAFGRLDARLAQTLLTRSRDGCWDGTHQALAIELGTAREVVSRLLKDFERRGLVHLERGRVTLRSREALARLL